MTSQLGYGLFPRTFRCENFPSCQLLKGNEYFVQVNLFLHRPSWFKCHEGCPPSLTCCGGEAASKVKLQTFVFEKLENIQLVNKENLHLLVHPTHGKTWQEIGRDLAFQNIQRAAKLRTRHRA